EVDARLPDLVAGVGDGGVADVEIGHVVAVDAVLRRAVDLEMIEGHAGDRLQVHGAVLVGVLVAAERAVGVGAVGGVGVGEVHPRKGGVGGVDEAGPAGADALNRSARSRRAAAGDGEAGEQAGVVQLDALGGVGGGYAGEG